MITNTTQKTMSVQDTVVLNQNGNRKYMLIVNNSQNPVRIGFGNNTPNILLTGYGSSYEMKSPHIYPGTIKCAAETPSSIHIIEGV